MSVERVGVTRENYPAVETSLQPAGQIKEAVSMNKLNRWHGIAKVENQPVVCLNQDWIFPNIRVFGMFAVSSVSTACG
jgi:hypothetical protein